MSLRRFLLSLITRRQANQFERDCKHPDEAMRRLWAKEILPLLLKSTHWQQAKPTAESRLEDFPITEFEDYAKSLQQSLELSHSSLNTEVIQFWSETSGTSGVRKFFPITPSFKRQFQRTMGPFMHSLMGRFPGLFKRDILYLAGTHPHEKTPAGTEMGLISNFNYRHLPPLLKHAYALPYEVFRDEKTFEQWAPLYGLSGDVSVLFAVTPMNIEHYFRRCLNQFDEYLPYLLGDKALPADLPPLKIKACRQRYLSQLTKPQTLKALWPNLEFVCSWTSGLCELPAKLLAPFLGEGVCHVDGTYSATEGWMTVCLDDGPGGVLHPGAHLLEFLEEGKPLEAQHLIPSWQLQVGGRYEVFLTTAMGFVRYRLKDVVKCTDFHHRAPRLEFCHKASLLKLEYAALTEQELCAMLKALEFDMAPFWYFARNEAGDRVVLVTDSKVSDTVMRDMHQYLIAHSPVYRHSVESGETKPLAHCFRTRERLVKQHHAQTKPKLISQEVINVQEAVCL